MDLRHYEMGDPVLCVGSQKLAGDLEAKMDFEWDCIYELSESENRRSKLGA
jgi:hypothetical protein